MNCRNNDVRRRRFGCCVRASVNAAQTETRVASERKCSYLAKDLRAPLGSISGAEDEDEDEDGGGGGGGGSLGPRSALLRTAGPHRRNAFASLLGHSHHWLIWKARHRGGLARDVCQPSPCLRKVRRSGLGLRLAARQESV